MDRLTQAVEDLAQAMGWLVDPLPSQVLERRELPTTSFVLVTGPPSTAERCEIAVVGRGEIAGHAVTFVEAMLVLRCGLLGTTRVRCPDCEDGTRWRCVWTNYVDDTELAQSECDARTESLGVPHRVARDTDADGRSVIDVLRGDPCPTCTGPAVECSNCKGEPACGECEFTRIIPGKPTGHVDRSWAEVLLGAMPRECATCDDWDDVGETTCPECEGASRPGDPEARAKLTRLADELQLQSLVAVNLDKPEQAPELGVWLALWLGQQPCEACFGGGTNSLLVDSETGRPAFPCHSCAGSGLALGSHATAMAEAGHALADELDRRPRAAVK